MANSNHPKHFGKRREPVQIVIANGSNVRSFFLKPWITTTVTLFAIVFTVTYLAATSYLVFRDDLITFADHRTDRMRHDYEDRIAYLRSQIDKMTSRSLVDQETLEAKLEIMLRRQDELSTRHEIVTSVLDLARHTGIKVPATLQQPRAKPVEASIGNGAFLLRKGTASSTSSLLQSNGKPQARLGMPDIDLATTYESVDQMALETSIALDAVRVVAETRSRRISNALKTVGLRIKTETGLGGPFIPAAEDEVSEFTERARQTRIALENFKTISAAVDSFPIGAPIENAKISSHYGRRLDPFLKRPALHSGIDYRAARGHPVIASGNGTVVSAGRHGGYGRMVEIAHGNGLTTRYAHLSRIRVVKGQDIKKGALIGNVGSTGRSTGPHLHYEVRSGERPSNPMPYIAAGRKIRSALK